MLTGCTFYNAILLHKNVECKIRQINVFFLSHPCICMYEIEGPGCDRGVGVGFTFKLSRFPFWCGARLYVMKLKGKCDHEKATFTDHKH